MNKVRAIPWVCSQRFRWMTIIVVTMAGGMWLEGMGSVPVISISIATSLKVPFWYMVTAFPVLGMLVADVFVLGVTYRPSILWIELACQIALLVFISSLRLSLAIPISGHSLLFSYFLLRRVMIGIPRHGSRRVEILIAVPLLLVVAYMKIFRWHDFVSLFSGGVIAALMVCVSYIVTKNRRRLSGEINKHEL